MAWRNKYGPSQEYKAPEPEAPIPDDTNCDSSSFEVYMWRAYTSTCHSHVKDTVKWEKLEGGYYKATLRNGDVIFFDVTDRIDRYLKAAEAKFDTEKTWLREFSRRLNYAMKRAEVNQLELSNRTGISQSALSSYLNCRRVPSAYTLSLLAASLKTTTQFLSSFK